VETEQDCYPVWFVFNSHRVGRGTGEGIVLLPSLGSKVGGVTVEQYHCGRLFWEWGGMRWEVFWGPNPNS
jgi:hypothetical protein